MMSDSMKSFQQILNKVCEEHDLVDPTALLVGLTNGVDLRKVSLVYQWILAFEEENGDEVPEDFDWCQLKDLIKNEGRYAPVSLSDSLSAQKTLLEYMHPKKKSIDLNQSTSENVVQPLKPSEVKRFKRIFDAKC